MRNLDAGNRDLLFAASVLGSFSTASLRHLVPSASNTAIDWFISRHLVRSTHDEWLPFALHDNVRDAVYGATSVSGGAWSRNVWQETSQLAVTWLLQALPSEAKTSADRSKLSQAAILVARLSAGEDLRPEFVQLIIILRELGLWLTLDAVEALLEPNRGTDAVRDLCVCIELIRSTHMTRREVAVTAKSIVVSSQDEHIRLLASQVGFAAAMVCGDMSAGRAFLLTRGESPAARLDLAWRESDFRGMALILRGDAPKGTIEQIRQTSKVGHLALAEGQFDDALRQFDEARSLAEQVDSALWIGRTSRHAAMAATFAGNADSARRVTEAAQHNLVLYDVIGHNQCLALTALHRAADGKVREAFEGFRSARNAMIAFEAWGDAGFVIMLEVLADLRYDLHLPDESRVLLDDDRVWRVHAWRREIIAAWMGHPSPAPSPQWSREPLEVFSSWREVIAR